MMRFIDDDEIELIFVIATYKGLNSSNLDPVMILRFNSACNDAMREVT